MKYKTNKEAFDALNKAIKELKDIILEPFINFIDKHPIISTILILIGFLFVALVLSYGIYDMTRLILQK